MIGKSLGHYQITSQLGKGGMGVVYQAKDQKLGRDVAIKVLPEEFARDADRVARFQREAKLLASLNHPNIAAIHGLEESGGTNFLVMELVEGETLADRIKVGAIPVEEALKLALQIAEALEAAHEKGVIHRDLKPANIKVTPEGKIKVLDFGLAKAFAGEQEVNLSNSPTLSDMATQQGVILGTAAYMSPEQARGSAVDKRCDIWSFGVVLFEMLTGKQLFAGETISDTLAAVLRADVDWGLLPANISASIRTLLHRCLARDRRQRLQAIGDARIVIEEYISYPSGTSFQAAATVAGSHKLRERLGWTSAVVILAAALTVLGIIHYRKISEPYQVTMLEYTLPEDQQFSSLGGEPFLAISPDGSQFAFITNKGLFVRSLNQWDAKPIVEANDTPSNPFFSPDGQWVAYRSIADNKLKKVSVKGGVPIALCDIGWISGAYWDKDDTIFCAEYGKASMMRVSANGGNPEVIFKGDSDFHHPRLLPDRKSLLFTLAPYPYRIATRSTLGSRESKILIPKGDRAFYLPTGHLVYGIANRLYAVSFNPSEPMQSGASVPVVEGIFRPGVSTAPQYDISLSGTLIYAKTTSGDDSPQRALVWVTRDGREEPIDIPPQAYNDWSAPKISPDGMRIALTIDKRESTNIWIADLVRKTLTPVTNGENENSWPVWTPNGKQIIYRSSRDGVNYDINRRAADGSGEAEKLGSPPVKPGPFSLLMDGRALLSWDITYSPYQTIISILSLEGGLARKPLLQSKYFEQHPVISPDGRWLAYASDQSGGNEVYVRPFPEVNNGILQVSTNGGYGPLWSPNGRELFYRNGNSVMAVAVDAATVFKQGQPKEIFRGAYFSSDAGSSKLSMWDMGRDGRFLMMKEPGSKASTAAGARKICVILNWFEELKQQVPIK